MGGIGLLSHVCTPRSKNASFWLHEEYDATKPKSSSKSLNTFETIRTRFSQACQTEVLKETRSAQRAAELAAPGPVRSTRQVDDPRPWPSWQRNFSCLLDRGDQETEQKGAL